MPQVCLAKIFLKSSRLLNNLNSVEPMVIETKPESIDEKEDPVVSSELGDQQIKEIKPSQSPKLQPTSSSSSSDSSTSDSNSDSSSESESNTEKKEQVTKNTIHQ